MLLSPTKLRKNTFIIIIIIIAALVVHFELINCSQLLMFPKDPKRPIFHETEGFTLILTGKKVLLSIATLISA